MHYIYIFTHLNICIKNFFTASSSRSTVKFDNRSTFAAPLPAGGYPSLLKQQLRDLVLRRKSLVREEPEDDSIISDAFSQQWPTLNFGRNTQLKTGFYKFLIIIGIEVKEIRVSFGIIKFSAKIYHLCFLKKNIKFLKYI